MNTNDLWLDHLVITTDPKRLEAEHSVLMAERQMLWPVFPLDNEPATKLTACSMTNSASS